MMNRKVFFHKLLNWEYWPTFMFYLPNIPYVIYLAIKAKSPVFYTATNPAIKNSGDGTESKYKTVQLIPKKYRPKTVFATPNEDFKTVLMNIETEEIKFPLIAKPDIGFRGMLVKKINSENELKEYLKKYHINIIIQEFITYKHECGILYCRLPNEKKGTITSITLKKFSTVIGNGKSTLSELILIDERAKIYYNLFQEIHNENMLLIPKHGEEVILTAIGNHSKGTEFLGGNDLINERLINTIDTINKQINGWYYGRLDIKYDTFEGLEKGDNFKILEINGIISEATHVFDSKKYSYFDAVKAIKNHWKTVYNIAIINHKIYGVKYAKTFTFLKDMKGLRNYIKKVKKLSP
ncbi:MAG: D-alanine--D-alanine ligase [Lutibacter sp.]|nr:MAG: D-alanine--D-alanine ligase [Lutibacter sp.]